MTALNKQALREAAEKATPGEWVYLPKNTSIEYDYGSDDSQGSITYMDSGDFTQKQTDLNGAFIAAANPSTVLALLDENYRLTAERDALRENIGGDNTRAAADIYFQLVEECEIPPGGSLVGYIDDIKERLSNTENYSDDLDSALCELLPGTQYMDPPDGGSVTPLEQVRRMVADYRGRIEELESRELVVKQFDDFQIVHYGATEDYAKGYIDCQNNYNKALAAAGIGVKGE
ncbi:TPA: ead/Ea22-like family protein [Citrobacter freundii]|nr:ead/Ea22-like family protein [Citrobacter freundii]